MTPALHVFPTLACNGGCSFCAIIPGVGEVLRNDGRHVEPERWARILEKKAPNALYLTGGEPLLYQGLDVLVNAVKCPVWVYTSGTGDVEGFIGRVKDRKRLFVRLSFHPHLEFDTTIRTANLLRDMEVACSIHAVETSQSVRRWIARFRKEGHVLRIDPNFQLITLWSDGGPVLCNVPNVVVGPDAKVYPCTSKMVRGVDAPHGLEKNVPLSEATAYDCDEPDACCACDKAFLKRSAKP